uniref:Uncharacterized protein n=1 Tax=Astyanax mexicanus TaxID=7994 RepID=A0A8B9L7I7_ASTMX
MLSFTIPAPSILTLFILKYEENKSIDGITWSIFNLNRQYKTLQTNLEAKVEYLETRVSELQQQLGESTLTSLLACVLQGCLDSLLSHLAEARRNWEDVSSDIHQEFKDMLIELRLNPHYI